MRKNKKINNFGFKIISVLLAIIAWFTVANISDYQTTREISGILVTQINGDVLDELDQVYDVASGDTVDIIVKGRRSVIGTLGKDDFIAIADLSKMSITNTVSITVEAKSNAVKDEISITCVDNTMKLNLEDKITQQFPIKVVTSGETKTGYAVSSTGTNPGIVKLEGPESAVEKITEVRVLVDVEAKRASFETQAEIRIYDAYGEEIKNDKITMDISSTNVKVEIYPTKQVGIEVSLRGTPGDGYGVESVVYQPQVIELVGPEDALSKVEKVEIHDISVSGMTEAYQVEADIRDYLPDGVSVVGIPPEITVNMTIEKLSDKKLSLTANDIALEHKTENYEYEITLNNFSVVVSGFEDEIAPITITDILPAIDCSDFSVGNHNNVKISLKEIEGITYEFNGTVSVMVTENGK